MQETSSLLSVSHEGSPSFNTYSSSGGKLSEIAARVVQELKNETDQDDSERCKQPELDNHDDNNDGDKSDGEFEFSIVCREEESIPITADDIFYNGQIKPVYPLFNTDLLSKSLCAINEESTTMKTKETSYQHPLRQLFSEERELTYTTFSSSEVDELDGLEPGTYCVWRPKKAGESLPSPSDKITGSSKRWKFRNLCIGATATARTRSCS